MDGFPRQEVQPSLLFVHLMCSETRLPLSSSSNEILSDVSLKGFWSFQPYHMFGQSKHKMS